MVPAARARQIEVATERLRWTALRQGPRMILVNVPELVLRAHDASDHHITCASLKVIVGKALRTRTPLLARALRFIGFSPYWNVPPSLAVGESLLRDEAAWTEDRIREAMGSGASTTPRLRQPVPVLIAYSTVAARAGSGYFYPDLYGHDALLDRALRRRSAGLPPLPRRTGLVP